jgi:hypothetical protein
MVSAIYPLEEQKEDDLSLRVDEGKYLNMVFLIEDRGGAEEAPVALGKGHRVRDG